MGKKSPAPPPAPDYTTLAIKQGEANLAAAKQSAYMSNPNIYTPSGTQTVEWTKTPTIDTDAYNKAMEAWQARAFNDPYGNAGEAPTQEQFTTYIEQPTVRQTINPNAEAALRQQELAQLYMSQAASGAASGLGNLGIASAFRPSGVPDLVYGAIGPYDNIVTPSNYMGYQETPGYTDISYANAGLMGAPTGAYTPMAGYNVEALPGQVTAGQQAQGLAGIAGANQPRDSQYYGVAQGGRPVPTNLGQLDESRFYSQIAPGGFDFGAAFGGPSGGLFGLAGGGPAGVQLGGLDTSGVQGVQGNVGQFGQAQGGTVAGPQLQGLDLSGLGGPMGGPQAGQFGYAQQFVQGPQLQGQIDVSNIAQGPINAGSTAQQAILSRLSPQLQGERQQLQTQLINQGLRPGGEAYNAAMSAQMQKENDLLLQAAAQGISLDQAARQQQFAEQQSRAMFANQAALSGFGAGMEQAGLYNVGLGQNFQQSLAAQQAQNQAQQQAFQQRLAGAEFGREGELARFGAGMQSEEARNRAIAQNTQQALASGQFANEAQAQQFAQRLAAGEFGQEAQLASFQTGQQAQQAINQAIAQNFAQAQAAQQMGNQAVGQNFEQALAAQQAQNAAIAQNYQQALGAGQFNREALLQQFGMGQQAQQLTNEAIAQNYNRDLALQAAQNQALQQVFGQQVTQAELANAAAGQNFQQQLAAQQANLARQAQQAGQAQGASAFYNQAQAQAMQQELARQQAQNATQGQQFQQIVQQQEARNAALSQRFQQDMARVQAQNAAQQQQYNQAFAQAQFRNTAAQQALAQQAAIRSLPVNEISALLSGGQVSIPQFQGYSGVNIAPPPVFQAGQAAGDFAQRNYQNQVGAYNAGMGMLGQLAGAAGTAIGGAGSIPGLFGMSDRRLKSNIVRVGTHPLGIGIYEYDIFGERQRGVMADELEAVLPEAVAIHPSGYKMVNYGML